MNNGVDQQKKQAAWHARLLLRTLPHAADLDEALRATQLALSIQPFPDESDIEAEEEPEWDNGNDDGTPVDAAFAFDIFHIRAQGILNRAMEAAKKLSSTAREKLVKALKETPATMARKVVEFVNEYRLQLARLLGVTQLASLLEGAREAARSVPSPPPDAATGQLPPSLSPEQADKLIKNLRALGQTERESELYKRPVTEQDFLRRAVQSPPPEYPPFLPLLSGEGPERILFPIIEQAAKELSTKNLVTRDVFDRLDAATRQKAFTVAGVDAQETLGKIRDTISENIAEGADHATFRKAILERVDEGTFLSEGHLETVFRSNVQSQFSDGQMQTLQHPFVRSGFPYAVYDAIHDSRTRENHLALEKYGIDGTNVYRINDPVFQTFRPPWDYNDRCGWTAVTVSQAADMGIKEAKQWLASGVEPTPPAFVQMPPFRPPATFQRSLASLSLSVRLSLLPIDEFKKPEEVSTEELAGDGMGEGNTVFTQPGDFTKEGVKGPPSVDKRKNAISGRAKKFGQRRAGKGRAGRRLHRSMRVSRKWKSRSAAFAVHRAPQGEHPGMMVDYILPQKEAEMGIGDPNQQPTQAVTLNELLQPLAVVGPGVPFEKEPKPKAEPVKEPSSKAGITATPNTIPDKIGVFHDWDTLKTIMVGIPDNDVLPAWYPDWEDPNGNEIDGAPPGQTKREANPEKFAGAVRQTDALCELLEREGVKVYRSPLTPLEVGKAEPVGLTAQYIREQFAIVGTNIFLCQERAAHRNKERAAIEPFFQAIAQNISGTRLFTVPTETLEMNRDWEGDKRHFLEGGDIYRLGKDVLVGMSYLATSPTGFRWMAECLEQDGFNCYPAYLTHEWEHTDYILTLVREGLCIAYVDGFRDGILPAPITDWNVIEVTHDEAYRRFAANAVTLRPGVVLLPEGNRRVAKELEKKGCDVIEVECGDIQFWQGALDCATNELLRVEDA